MPNLKEIFAKLKLNTLMPDLKYNQNSPKEVTLNNTKIDYKVINTLLVQYYTKTILTTIKNELSEKYLKLREQEKQLEPHSTKHIIMTEQMHRITEDISKIQAELSLLDFDVDSSLLKIKHNLNLQYHLSK